MAIAKNIKPTTKNSPKVVVGKNPNNKPAEAYAAQGAKDKLTYETGAHRMTQMNPSVGGISKGNYPADKTTGVKIRGTGAATKGTMARGPMA